MTDDTPKTPEPTPADKTDRIAKVMARAGVASRREAERMIVEGRVKVNGKLIDSPALDVAPTDRVTVDGKPLEAPQETRLWLYYKPLGLITSENDELGRQTVFDALPRDLPRVMTVGRLDLNSEGLLLLTNDGELKRRLELPATGWLRRYRVRVNGTPSDMTFGPLRRGATIDGEDFAPMEIKLDSQQGANAWLTVGIREGKNREIRRAMMHVGLQVNRLIRIGYGPFKLTGMEKNEVSEVKRRVLRDQLGGLLTGEVTEKDREMRPRGADHGEGRPPRGDAPRFARDGGARDGGREGRPPRKEWQDRGDAPRRFPREDGDNQDRPRRFGAKPADARDGDRPQFNRDRADRGGDRPGYKGDRPQYKGDRPQFGKSDRPDNRGDRPQYNKGERPQFNRGDRPDDRGDRFERKGDRPDRAGDKPARKFGAGPRDQGGQGGYRDRKDRPEGGDRDGQARGYQRRDRDSGDKPGYKGGDKPGYRTGPSASRFAGQKGAGAPAGRRPEGEPYKGPRDKGESRPVEDGKARSAYPRSGGKPAGRADGNGPRPYAGKPSFGKPSGGKPSGRPSGGPSGKPFGGSGGGRPKSGPRR